MANKNTIVKKIVVGTPVRTIQATQVVSTANISDVSVDSIAHGDLLVYDSASGKYTATSISGGNGINVTYTPGAFGDIEINATSSITSGIYGNTARIPVISVDSNGLIDSIGSVLVSVAGGDAITGIDYDSATGTLTVTTGDALTYSTVISLDAFNTDNLSEGSTNKYYTKARVDSDITALVDADYIQARQADIFRDSAFVTDIIDSNYIQTRQLTYLDSYYTTTLVDSAYVQNRQVTYNTSNFLDSDTVSLVVDAAYVQARQTTYNTSDFLDSTTVENIVDAAYIQARQLTYLDSYYTTALVDSAYVQARQSDVDLSSYATQSYVTARVDSAVNALIDAAPGALNTLNELAAALNNDDSFATTVTNSIATKLAISDFNTYFDSALGTKTTDNVTEGSNLYFTNARAQGAITVTDAGGDGSLTYAGGTITYTGPSASEVRAHFTAGPSIDITDGVVKVDSASIVKVAGIETNKVHTTDSGLRVYGNILPSADSTYSLGDSNHKWKALYVSGNTITLGTINLQDDGGSFTVSNVSGGAPAVLNLSANTTDDLSEGSTNKYYTSTRVDSDITALVDAAYIQARQADIFRDSAFITNIVDSAYVATKVAANVTTRYLQLDSNLPGDTTNKLYSQNGNLYWNGAALDSLGIGYTPMNKAGDTMTGDLVINKLTPQIKFNDNTDGGVEVAMGVGGENFYLYEPEDVNGDQVPYAIFGVGREWLRIEDVSQDAYLFNRLVWTSGNDGSGTGLDADLLDGQEGNYYLNYNNLTNRPNLIDTGDVATLIGELNTEAIQSVVDSAYVQARQDYAYSSLTGTPTTVSTFTNDANYLDSTTVQGVIDATYIQANQTNFLDSYYTTALIDSAYVIARAGQAGTDSATVINLITETVDSAYVAARVGDLGIDSASTIALITETVDSAYINARVNANVDSAQVQLIIDSNFQNLSQNIIPDVDVTRDLGNGAKRFRRIYAGERVYIGTNLILRDSADTLLLSGGTWGINNQVDSYVDSTYVRARQDYAYSSLTGAPTTVSSFINDVKYLDSTTVTNVIDATYVQAIQTTYTNVSEFVNDANYLDSTTAEDFIDSAYVQLRVPASYIQSNQITYTNVSEFINDANYLDSTTVLPLFSARNGITYDNTTGIFGLDSQANVEFGNVTVDGTLLVNSSSRTKGLAVFETDVIVDGDFYVNGTQTTISTQSLSVGDNLIHLADSNEISDTLDIGFVGHYYGDGQRRHTGFFRDASNSQYYIFNNYVDSDLDSSVSTGEINRGDASFQLATLNVGTLIGNVTGDVTGTVSSLSNHTTTNLTEGNNLYYTTARADSDARSALVAVDAGGDGSFTYDSASGTFTYTGPSASEVRAHFSAGTGIDITSGVITLQDTSVTAGTYGSSTRIPIFTVDSQGRIDSASDILVAGVTSFVFDSSDGAIRIGTADAQTFSTRITLDPFTTANLTESGNLYYTTARHDSDTFAQVDSSYVQLRQDYAYSSLTGSPTNVSFFTNDANYLDSTTVQSVIDATYIQANQTNFLDSVYAIALIDSAYVNARTNVGVGIQHFVYTATDGQTTFSGNDYYGNSLSYVNTKEQVYRNGVLLVRGDQYTATSGNSVVILNGCDSDDVISISAFSNTRFLDNVSDSGDGITVTGNLSVQGDLNFTGSIAIRGLQEPIVQKSGSINVVNYSFDSGAVFYETAPDSDWTANFTDIPTTLHRATVMTIITEQGADSAFLPLNIQIEGVPQIIKWEGSSAPTPSTNATDQTSFTLLRVDSSGTDVWKVLGQNVSYA